MGFVVWGGREAAVLAGLGLLWGLFRRKLRENHRATGRIESWKAGNGEAYPTRSPSMCRSNWPDRRQAEPSRRGWYADTDDTYETKANTHLSLGIREPGDGHSSAS